MSELGEFDPQTGPGGDAPQSGAEDITLTAEITHNELYAKRPERAFLVIVHGDPLGHRIDVGGAPVTIGRGAGCDIQLADAAVSRVHCRLEPTADGVRLRDEGSRNRTYVDDQPIASHPLKDGEVVRVGRTMFKFLTGANVEAAYHEEIFRVMTTDALTWACSRRALTTELDKAFRQASRHGRPLALLMLDLDRFKRVNDTWGHLAGDHVLATLGAVVRAIKRGDDTFGRFGGEEFCLVMPETGLADASAVAERIRRAVEQATFRFEDAVIPVTISIGAATRDDGMSGFEALIKQADERLYAAKEGGRNRVVPQPEPDLFA